MYLNLFSMKRLRHLSISKIGRVLFTKVYINLVTWSIFICDNNLILYQNLLPFYC